MPHWCHNTNLQAVFDALTSSAGDGDPLTPEEAAAWLAKFLTESWERLDGTKATYVQMTPDQPEGWHFTCDANKLYIVRPDESRWPSARVLLADRVFMEGPDGPRRGKPLMGGRPIPVIIGGPPAAIVEATEADIRKAESRTFRTERRNGRQVRVLALDRLEDARTPLQRAVRDFHRFGAPYQVKIIPTRDDEIEWATELAAEILRHERATNPELYEKAIDNWQWTTGKPTDTSRVARRIIAEARTRTGVSAIRNRPKNRP